MTAREIRQALACGRSVCPCALPGTKTHCVSHHPDRTPSLDVVERDGKVLVCCRAGCSQAEVISALAERGLWKARPSPSGGREQASEEDSRPLHRQALDLVPDQPWARPGVLELYHLADQVRWLGAAVDRLRARVTQVGESEEAWEVLAYANELERTAAVLEADLDQLADRLQRRRRSE